MKIKYNNYTFIGNPIEEDNQYANGSYIQATDANANGAAAWFYNRYNFDNNKFQQMIAQRQYEQAADYASQYHFDDPRVQREHENDILNIRRQGRILGAVYGRLDGATRPNDPKSTLKQVEFYENLFINGGLETIDQNNQYLRDFETYKRNIGSTFKKGTFGYTDQMETEATALSITFYPKEQTLLGADRLAKDNNNYNIDVFWANSGLTEQQLLQSGVSVTKSDGATTIKFNKSNPLANQILCNLPYSTYTGGDLGRAPEYLPRVVGYDAQGNTIGDMSLNGSPRENIGKIQSMVNDAKNSRDIAFADVDTSQKLYSSTIGPALDDSLMELNAMLAAGQITESDYNRRVKLGYSYVEQAVKTLGSGNYEMYSNAFNESATDETLAPMDNLQRGKLNQRISSSNIKNMYFNAMVSNGKIGTLITIDASQVATKDQSDTNDPSDLVNTRRYQIFIPGLMQEQAQAKINQDTGARAAQEINAMQDFGYEYKLDDGTSLVYNGNGGFNHGDQVIDMDAAKKLINRSMIVEDAAVNLKYQYTNKEGELFDKQGYEDTARKLSIAAANELYPDVSLEKPDGTKYTVDEIFAMMSSGGTVSNEYSSNINFDVYSKLVEIYGIYNRLMSQINNQ